MASLLVVVDGVFLSGAAVPVLAPLRAGRVGPVVFLSAGLVAGLVLGAPAVPVGLLAVLAVVDGVFLSAGPVPGFLVTPLV